MIIVDDPLDATAVHFGGGVWGVVAGPIFKSNGLLYIANKKNLMVNELKKRISYDEDKYFISIYFF